MKTVKNMSGKDVLGKCQYRVWEVQMELETYAGLFIAGGNESSEVRSLTGAGLAFERMARKLDKVWVTLDEEFLKEEKVKNSKTK